MKSLKTLLQELNMSEYMTLQIKVGKIVAKKLGISFDELFEDTSDKGFAKYYADAVDREKDSAPTVNKIVSIIMKKMK